MRALLRCLFLLSGATCASACGSTSVPPDFFAAPPPEPPPPVSVAQGEGAGLASTDPASAPTAAVTAAPSASSPPVAPPVDEVPEKLGTPASSLAAAPAFWRRRGDGYAPELDSPWTIFDAAGAATPPGGAAAPGAALACRLSTGRFKEDKFIRSFEKADLMVTATFGKGKDRMTFQALGPEDDNEMDFFLPLVPLLEGEGVAISLVDRDVFSHDGIARFTITRRGSAPLTLRAAGARGECRSVPRAVVEASFLGASASADKELAKMDSQRFDIATPSLGIGRTKDGLGDMAKALEALAALVGWDDPRVVRRVERTFALRAAQAADLGRQVEQRRATLPSPVDGATSMADGALEVRATKYECGPGVVKTYRKWMSSRTYAEHLAASGCVVHLVVRSHSAAPMVLGALNSSIGPLDMLGLISKTGYWFDLRLFAEVKKGAIVKLPSSDRRRLRLGEVAEVVALPYREDSDEKPEPPLLLRGMYDERMSASATEWTSMVGGKLQVRATRIACDQTAATEYARLTAEASSKKTLKAGGCVARIEIRNTSSEPVKVDSFRIGPLHRLDLIAPAVEAAHLDVIGKVDKGAAIALKDKLMIAPSEMSEVVVATNRGGFPAGLTLDKCQLFGDFGYLVSFARVD